MKPIASFTIDHLKLEPGLYVSRVDAHEQTGTVVTTFDVRMTAPNREPVLDTAAVHAIEHLGASFLRNHPTWSSRVVYFGPMGCRTGFYLLVFGSCTAEEIKPLVEELFSYIASFEGEIPGASPAECGNWHDSDLGMARYHAKAFLKRMPTLPTVYPS